MKEICVLCGKESIYDKDTHIDRRYFYVEGAGQLCRECYDKIYNKVRPAVIHKIDKEKYGV